MLCIDQKKFISKIFVSVLIMILCIFFANKKIFLCHADTQFFYEQNYKVFDYYGNLISERFDVEINDVFITKDFDEYEIIEVDKKNYTATAKYNGYYIPPNVVNKENNVRMSQKTDKSVGLYMTHNDESYEPSDGYSSIYGKGGIHDVAKSLKTNFENLGYSVLFDETLHLPHNSSAYSRSATTAENLLKNNPDALFDIHRDGVSRSVYVKNVDGKERCKVRIVVGQANPNKEANLQFAMYLMSVAEEYCPWLFLDIYMAKGHYNQALTSKGLLFEMGTYLAEKELAIETTKYLAEVVDKTLFSTIVEDEDTLTIVDENIATNSENGINNILNELDKTNKTKASTTNITLILVLSVMFVVLAGAIVLRKKNKIKFSQK